MTLPEILQFCSAACAVASTICAVAVARRAQRWRDTDEAQGLLKRIDDAESRLDKLEVKTNELATKADIRGLKSEIDGVCKQIDQQVVPGLNRIEDYFLKLGMGLKS